MLHASLSACLIFLHMDIHMMKTYVYFFNIQPKYIEDAKSNLGCKLQTAKFSSCHGHSGNDPS
jgi:hypothetical protein